MTYKDGKFVEGTVNGRKIEPKYDKKQAAVKKALEKKGRRVN